MALHVPAQCTARLLLAHRQKQKQGRQRAGIGSRDNEEEGMRSDWALADLGMEERVKRVWCVYVCVLHAFRYRLIDCLYPQLVAPPEAVPQKELAKLLNRPLPKGLADALFTYEVFLHCLGRMTLSA